MPTYEFRCPDGHEFEKFYRTISGAASEAVCPVCGKTAERMMSAAGFAFKGSGFYLTDYGKNAHRDKGTPEVKSGDAAGRESGGESPSSKPESAGSDAKSDAKSDATKSEGKSSEAKSAESSSAGGESKKTEKKAEPKAEAKPAPAPPKPGKSE